MTEGAGDQAMLAALGDRAMARVDARAAAGGVRIAPVTTAAGHHEVAGMFGEIWDAPGEAGPVRAGTMRAAQHVGAYVIGIHAADPDGSYAANAPAGPMVGASFAFHAADGHLHSHVTGVVPEHQGRGLGLLTKLHQRAWCLQRGVARVTWTFDPLVQRNARFNLHRLGADLVDYLPSFYGPMADGINAGDDTDRAFVVWRLASPRVARALGEVGAQPRDTTSAAPEPIAVVADDDGRPSTTTGAADAPAVSIATPTDIESLRRRDRDLALRWRHVVREAMLPRLRAGWRVAGMTTEGTYVLEAP